MSQEDKGFYIRHSGKEYVVMTTQMHREIMMGDPTKAGKFLEELGSKTIVAHDQLYLILTSMARQYQADSMTIQG